MVLYETKDKWSLDGDYQETLCKFDQLSPQSFLSTNLDGFLR